MYNSNTDITSNNHFLDWIVILCYLITLSDRALIDQKFQVVQRKYTPIYIIDTIDEKLSG
jgi:hypothetical protein